MKEYKTGDRVRITAGQYKGMIGKLRGVSKDSGRCTVELDAGSDPSLLDNCYFTSIIEIEHAPDDIVSKPTPKSFDDLDALAAKAKEEAKSQPKTVEPKRPLFARRNKAEKSKSSSVQQTVHSNEATELEEDIFVDDFAAASVDNMVAQEYVVPKEYNPEEFNPQSFEPLPASEPEPQPIVPEPMPEPISEPVVQESVPPESVPTQGSANSAPIISNPIPSSEKQAPVSDPPIITDPIPSQESVNTMEASQPESQLERQQKEMQQKPMDKQEFVPKFRQEIPKPQEFIPLPCRNCRLKDQRENCSPKEFSECQAAYAFDEYLKEHSVQLFVEQILIPEMNQVGVTETEKKAMLQRLLLEL